MASTRTTPTSYDGCARRLLLSALMLAAIAWLPPSQWSLATMPNGMFAKEIDTRKPTLNVRKLNQESRSVIESTTAVASTSEQAADNRERSSTGSRVAAWIFAHMQDFDESLRSAEQSGSVRVSRLSARGIAFFLVGLALMTGLWFYGCLVPRANLWRWASCLTIATTLLIVPLRPGRNTRRTELRLSRSGGKW